VRERLRNLGQEQLCVGGEANLHAEERGRDPEADDHYLGAGYVQIRGRERPSRCIDRLTSGVHVHHLPPCGRGEAVRRVGLHSRLTGMTERADET
jgi:hypothetical protein